MRARSLLLPSLFVGALVLAGWLWLRPSGPAPSWTTVGVARKDVRATVSATGTLDAVTTVEVGTQVSGTVQALYADYNDPVELGQVLARIDTSLLEADVETARASLALREAELAQAQGELDRTTALMPSGSTSEEELATATTTMQVARAQVRSARVGLERATRNLGYATILSPVSGTVVERDVDVGQTVNAGTTAPRLFLIAGALDRMQILASVDEADIGRIKEGQPVDFTVQAYASDTFHGQTRQVRLQSTISENVVTYTVVIDVDNSDGRLLPGMTATVDFIVAEAKDVLCVPNAALRFRPEPTQMAAVPDPAAAGAAAGGGKGGNGARGRGGRRGMSDGKGTVWLADGPDRVTALPVATGLSDSECTELRGEGVSEELLVVTGRDDNGASEAGPTSPFQQKSSSRGQPGGF